MSATPKKKWQKPELTKITIEGKGNLQCTTGLMRVTVCNDRAGGAVGTVGCQQGTKNTVFS